MRRLILATLAITAAGFAVAGPALATGPSINVAFDAPTVGLGGTTRLTYTITNPGPSGLTGIGFTDSLPGGLVVATPNAEAGTCGGGTITAAGGATFVSLTGAVLAATAACSFHVDVEGTSAGAKTVTTTVSSDQALGNTFSASITVVAQPVTFQSFGAASIPVNGSTSLTFEIDNDNAFQVLSGIGFTDPLPAGLVIATPNGQTGACGAGTITAVAGSSTVSLSGGGLPAMSSCFFSVHVTGTTAGVKPVITSNVTSTEGGTAGTAGASLTVVAPPGIAMAFLPRTIGIGATTTLTFTLTNPAVNPGAVNGVAFIDFLPTGLTMSPSTTSQCGGTLGVAATSLTLSGASIAVGSSCSFPVTVTGTAGGAYLNTTAHVSSTNGGVGDATSANLFVGAPVLTEAFGAPTVALGASTALTFTVHNPNASVPRTGIGFTDALPVGLVVATPNGVTGTCGGVGAVAGSSTVSLSGASLLGGASCAFTVQVTGTTAGPVTNTTGAITSIESGPADVASAGVTVVAPPALSASFSDASIPLSGRSVLTFNVVNPNPSTALTGVGFNDQLSAGLAVSTPNALTGSCGGGTIGAAAGSSTVSLSGATLTGGAGCTFSVSVTGLAAGAQTESIAGVASAEGGSGPGSSATINVVGSPATLPSSRISGLASSVKARRLTSFRGTAKAGTSRVAKVAIALERISGGARVAKAKAKAKATPRCYALSSKGRMARVTPKRGTCPALTFLTAKGTTKWTFELKHRLPAGSYVLTSRATDSAGRRETSFTTSRHNRVRFTVR